MLPGKVLFLTLKTFSAVGGIEKVCCIAGMAFYQIMQESGGDFTLYSMYDKQDDVKEAYVPDFAFKGFGGARIKFIKEVARTARTGDAVVLSHINLLPVAALIKLLTPKARLYLLAHGIEVWKPLQRWKIALLQKFERILPVSNFTRQKMEELYGLPAGKFQVVNNCLDPFLQKRLQKTDNTCIRDRLGFQKEDIILFTLTRLKFSEQYKGYDKVISVLPALVKQYPNLRYVIGGTYDGEEKARLDALIIRMGMQDHITFAGFIKEEDMEAFFRMADIYIMPSRGEGFGIVFIEALFYQKPVIAGNLDGSVDALDGGNFGILINPVEEGEIIAAILKILQAKEAFIPDEKKVMKKFGFSTYKTTLKKLLERQSLGSVLVGDFK